MVSADTKYWLSLVPDLAFPPKWGWAEGTGGDAAAYEVYMGAGALVPSDLAFTLTGRDAAPEPAITTATALWTESLSLPPWPNAPVWVHGDLHGQNLLARHGKLAAVIDFRPAREPVIPLLT